jgi:hypothetical protein
LQQHLFSADTEKLKQQSRESLRVKELRGLRVKNHTLVISELFSIEIPMFSG